MDKRGLLSGSRNLHVMTSLKGEEESSKSFDVLRRTRKEVTITEVHIFVIAMRLSGSLFGHLSGLLGIIST